MCWLLSVLSKQVALYLIEAKRKFHHSERNMLREEDEMHADEMEMHADEMEMHADEVEMHADEMHADEMTKCTCSCSERKMLR